MYYTYIQCDGGRKGDRRKGYRGGKGCRERGSDSGGIGGKGKRTMDESVSTRGDGVGVPYTGRACVCVCSSDPTPTPLCVDIASGLAVSIAM